MYVPMDSPGCLPASEVSQKDLEIAINQMLSVNELCTVATIAPADLPWAAAMYFAPRGDSTLVVMTAPGSRHFSSIALGGGVGALVVADTRQDFDNAKRGMQATVTIRQVIDRAELLASLEVYCARFPSARAWMGAPEMLSSIESRPFLLTIDEVKIFDEVTFGRDVWVYASAE
jgi:uncharacterized protein YhbP (UPF0306 family)